MSAFQDAIKRWAPPDWGYVPNLGTLLEAVGATLDEAMDRVHRSRSVGLVLPGEEGFDACEPDVVPRHSADRGLALYPTEPDASRRVRLSRFRQLHRRRGTHRGELEHAQPYFLPGTLPLLRVVHADVTGSTATWHTLDPSGVYSRQLVHNNWNWDGELARWSRWWAIVYLPGTRLEAFDGITKYDDGSIYNGGQVYDGFAADYRADLISIFRGWGAAHSTLWGVILCRDLSLLDPTGTPTTDPEGWTTYPTGKWGRVVDENNVPTRDPRLDFIYDLGEG